MNNDNNHIDQLIIRSLNKEASEKEIEELHRWMDASKENRNYFDGIRLVYQQAEQSSPVFTFNTDKAWDEVQKKMYQNVTPIEAEHKIFLQYHSLWFRVVASIVILFVVSTIILWRVNDINLSSRVQIETINKIHKTTLPDNSKVILNKYSKVTYTKDFSKNNREINLEGEAFFDLKHDSTIPFIIRTDEVFIKDIGTSFNVKSYKDSAFVKVYVMTGQIMFYSANNSGLSVFPGEIGIYDKKKHTFSKLKSTDSSVIKYIKRILVFEGNSLQSVVDQLNRMYVQKIVIVDPELKDREITVTFENENLEDIIHIIAETLGLRVRKQDQQWEISK